MTLTQYRTLVSNYTALQGASAYGAMGSGWNDTINRSLERFTEDTLYLYDDNVAFTLSATDTFSLRNTAMFAQKMCRIQDVWIGDVKIQQVASQQDMARIIESYVSQAAGTPRHWFTQGSASLVLYPEPSGAISNSRVSGWYLHPTLTDDADVLSLLDADLESAAKETAIALLEPRASGEMFNRIKELKAVLDKEKAKIRERAVVTTTPYRAMRKRSTVYSLR